LPNQKKQDI